MRLTAQARRAAEELAPVLGYRTGMMVILVLLEGQLDQIDGRLPSLEYRRVLRVLADAMGLDHTLPALPTGDADGPMAE